MPVAPIIRRFTWGPCRVEPTDFVWNPPRLRAGLGGIAGGLWRGRARPGDGGNPPEPPPAPARSGQLESAALPGTVPAADIAAALAAKESLARTWCRATASPRTGSNTSPPMPTAKRYAPRAGQRAAKPAGAKKPGAQLPAWHPLSRCRGAQQQRGGVRGGSGARIAGLYRAGARLRGLWRFKGTPHLPAGGAVRSRHGGFSDRHPHLAQPGQRGGQRAALSDRLLRRRLRHHGHTPRAANSASPHLQQLRMVVPGAGLTTCRPPWMAW